jgi:hypothetical protein
VLVLRPESHQKRNANGETDKSQLALPGSHRSSLFNCSTLDRLNIRAQDDDPISPATLEWIAHRFTGSVSPTKLPAFSGKKF